MRSRIAGSRGAVAILVAVAAIVLAVAGLVAIDLAREDRVPEGVSVDGVDVGGRTADEAAAVVRNQVAQPLHRTIVARHGDHEFELEPEEAELEVDVEATVDAALAQRRDGVPGVQLLVDLVREPRADVDLDPRLRYSREVVEGFAERVAGEVDRAPRDAEVEPSADELETTPAREGFEADEGELRARVQSAIESPGQRAVDVPGESIAPETTLDDLAERHPDYILIDRESFRLRHYENLELESTYRISVGDVGQRTPAGRYDISNKAVDPTWYVPEDADWAGDKAGEVIPPGPENPIKSRWLGIEDGIGIHGTDEEWSIGERASAGCIRMLIPEVEELYDRVPVGTPVYIG